MPYDFQPNYITVGKICTSLYLIDNIIVLQPFSIRPTNKLKLYFFK